jgi:hypothetical protein
MREFSLHLVLMLISFTVTVAISPYPPREDFPFSSVQEYQQFKSDLKSQMMHCVWESEETENWIRQRPHCYFGGYRPNGPETDL